VTPDISKPDDEDEDESEDEAEDDDEDESEEDSDDDDSDSEDDIDLSNYYTREEVQNLLKEGLDKTDMSVKLLQLQVDTIVEHVSNDTKA
jgi:ribonuclease E